MKSRLVKNMEMLENIRKSDDITVLEIGSAFEDKTEQEEIYKYSTMTLQIKFYDKDAEKRISKMVEFYEEDFHGN